MPERQRTRRDLDAVRVEDVIPPQLLEDVDEADREYLEQVFREPQKYLPPRSRRSHDARAEQPADQPEGTVARRAKLAGLVGAGALVAGAVVTAALLSRGPVAAVSADDTTMPAGFDGAAALGGQPVPTQRQHPSGSASAQHRETGSAPVAEEATPTSSGTATPSGTSSSPDPSSSPSSDEETTTPSDRVKLDAVRTFYSSIDGSPDDALALLTPKAAVGETGRLVRAWSEAQSIAVQDVYVQDDGSVFAAALVHQADGTVVRVTQLFDVLEQDVISQARLLSAVYA
ncbi:hypothetical protein [Amycolatopsis jiangsuensis]|uniref:Uncharacterized protein n=1 Tax=Amycolatopsis jiangsuensis TaxID=1181879 RepID=A0A840IXC1_9PSEU|nr:hypothetical protein [Amycolatopsis jiangsuensis]MBB4686363.1 hypothetical protein [Amycolatopsis jiangsuensis]